MMKFVFSGGKHLIQIDIFHLQWSAEMGENQQKNEKVSLFILLLLLQNQEHTEHLKQKSNAR